MTKLTFLGTGTSQGVPVIACGCWVCTSSDSRDKRLRSSVLVECGDTSFVIDAGPDFRQQMLREGVKKIDAILLTHEHKDHIGGIDDVRAFNNSSHQPMKIYSNKRVQRVIKKDFDYAFEEDRYPGAPSINLVTISADNSFMVNDIEIIPIEGKHYKLPVLGFRFGDIAYLTDFNYISESEIDKLKGVKMLIINALRHEHHLSHFTLSEALDISSRVCPERTFFTHISHQMGRMELIESELSSATYFAYDGLTVEVGE